MAKAKKTTEAPTVDLNAVIKEKDEQINALLQINEDLQRSLEEIEETRTPGIPPKKKPAVIPSKSFKVGKGEYVFIVPQFTNPLDGHTIVTAEEALTNKDLLAHLAENETGITKIKGS